MGFQVSGGKIVQLVETEVVEDEVEANLEAELNNSQDDLNTHVSRLAEAESQYQATLDAAEEAENQLKEAASNKEAAELRVSKSIADRDSWAAALELRREQLESQDDSGDDEDSDGDEDESDDDEPTESEEVPVAVTVLTPEG